MADEATTTDTGAAAPAAGDDKTTGAAAPAGATDQALGTGKPAETTETSTTVLGGPETDEAAAAATDDKGSKAAGDDATAADADTSFDLTLPEGMELDAEYKSELTALFKEHGVSKDAAQALINVHAKRVQDSEASRTEAFNQLTKDWLAASKADKEIGGEAFDQNVGSARLALKQFGTPELNELLHANGLGNHPEVVRVFTRIGKLLKEDQPGTLDNPKTEKLSREEIMYPTS